MVMQPNPISSPQATKLGLADAGKVAKRARTKHACDECRRSQKKCDGDKPLCRRCYLNGTHCTYTPHKSRNQCPCAGQGEETRGESSVPDVFVFADQSQSSFHTWSATSSPDQSPDASESALHTPPPTNLSQDDRFGTAQNAVLQLPETPYESEISPSPEMIHCGRNIYNHRSYSLPSFLSANSVPTSPQAPEYSSHNVPTSLSGNLVDEFSALAEAKLVPPGYFSAPAPERKISAAYLSSHCDITLHDQELSQRSVESGTFFDVSTHHGHQVPEMHLSQRQVSVHTADKSSVPLFGDHSYDVRQYMEGKYSTNSSPLSASDSSGAGHAVDAYSAWLAQIHANGAFSPSSDPRTDTSLNASIQNIYSASTHRSDYSSFEMMSQDAEPYAGITRARPSNTLGCNSPGVTRQYPGMMLQNLPAPRFSHNQWVNGPAPPPPNGSYPSSANPSPSACSTCSFHEWVQ